MRTIAIFATVAGLMAQPKYSDLWIIPRTTDSPVGTLSWLEKRANGVNKFTWSAPDSLAANVSIKWPTDGVTGYLFSDGAGNTSWQAAGTGCLGCMDLTTVQTASGLKTFSGGVILQGTSTARALNPEADNTYDFGTTALRWANIWGVNLKSRNGEVIVQTAGGVDRAVLGVNGFTGYDITPSAANTIYATGGGFQGFNTTLAYGVAGVAAIDSARAGFLTQLTLNTGAAVVGYCWTATSVGGAANWAPCAAGGSFVTTNTAQTVLTGTKSWDSAHTHNASILSGTHNTYNIGDPATAFANMYSLNMQPVNLEINDSARAAFWRIKYGSVANSLETWSGSGAQQELQTIVYSATDSQWLFRGTIAPLVAPAGANGDIGQNSNKFRSAYFSAQVNAETGSFSGSSPGVTVTRSGSASMFSTSIQGLNSASSTKLLMSWGGSAGALIRTYSNTSVFQNSMDETDGVMSNIGFSIGVPFATNLRVIDNTGHATFPALTLPVGAVVGYVWTATDGLGNGAWAVNATGSYVTTNTNQTALAGTKEWSNTHTFNGGVAVKLNSTARNWDPEADIAYDLGSVSASWNNIRGRNGNFVNMTVTGTCTGCSSITNYVTTNSTQSNLTGGKSWEGLHQFYGQLQVRSNFYQAAVNGAVSVEMDVSASAGLVIRRPLFTGVGNAMRIKLWHYTGLFEESGSISTYSGSIGSEVEVNTMSKYGFNTTYGYAANGSYGLSLTCSAGQTVRQPVYIFGLLVSGTCGI